MTTLIVEDGTGVTAANAYADAGHAGSYHASRGTAQAWLAMVEAGADQGMLIEATRKLEQSYRWLGRALLTTQGLGLPRDDITLDDGRALTSVQQVAIAADAVSWLALRLWNDQRVGGERTVRSESLPDYSVTYADEAVSYGEVDAILGPLIEGGALSGGFSSGRLVRWS